MAMQAPHQIGSCVNKKNKKKYSTTNSNTDWEFDKEDRMVVDALPSLFPAPDVCTPRVLLLYLD